MDGSINDEEELDGVICRVTKYGLGRCLIRVGKQFVSVRRRNLFSTPTMQQLLEDDALLSTPTKDTPLLPTNPPTKTHTSPNTPPAEDSKLEPLPRQTDITSPINRPPSPVAPPPNPNHQDLNPRPPELPKFNTPQLRLPQINSLL